MFIKNKFYSSLIGDRPQLSIIKNVSIEQQIADALSDLQDNNIPIQQEKDNGKKHCLKTFISSSKQSELINQIKSLIDQTQLEQLQLCQSLLQQLQDGLKMQLNQVLSNILLFSEFSNKNQINTVLGSLYFLKVQQKQNEIKGQKIALLNLTGLEFDNNNQFFKIFREQSQRYSHDIYLEIKNSKLNETRNKPNYQYLFYPQNTKITWLDIKYILKQFKKQMDQAKSQVIILQFCIDLNQNCFNNNGEVLQFELACITKIVRFFSKSMNKLFINIITKKNSSSFAVEQNIQEQNIQQRKCHYQIKQFINAIEQGILNDEIKDQDSLLVNKENINQLQYYLTKEKGNQLYQEFRRINNSFLIRRNIQQKEEIKIMNLESKIPIIQKFGNVKFIQLIYNGKILKFTKQSYLIVNYKKKVVILFNHLEFKLYYCQIDFEDCIQLYDTIEIDISIHKDKALIQEINREIAPNIAIVDQKIYIMYGYLGSKLLEYNIKTNTLLKKNKQYLPAPLKQLEDSSNLRENIKQRDGAVVCYDLFKKSKFALVGGELGQESLLCNMIEIIQVQDDSFQSGQISKEHLNKQKSMKPFKNAIILEEQNYFILLPGDYNNQNYKYSQIINPTFYKQAMKLKKGVNSFQWEYLDIVYSNEILENKYPIHTFNSKQQNIIKTKSDCWSACFSLFDEVNQFACAPKEFQNSLLLNFTLSNNTLLIGQSFLSENSDNSTQFSPTSM